MRPKHALIGLLFNFWTTNDFPEVNLGDFKLQRVDQELLEDTISKLGRQLSTRDLVKWRGASYWLRREYTSMPSDSDLKDHHLIYHRFAQFLRVMRPNPVIVQAFQVESANIKPFWTKPDEVYPAIKWNITESTFATADSRSLAKYFILYEKAASTKGYDRLATAFYFFENFFHTRHPRIRIAAVVTALEALFNDGVGDTAYKVSLRCAAFLETNPTQRLKTFNALKEIYKLRSKTIHGQSLDKVYKNPQSALNLIAQAEDYVRRCLILILENDSHDLFKEDSKKVGHYMDKLILGA